MLKWKNKQFGFVMQCRSFPPQAEKEKEIGADVEDMMFGIVMKHRSFSFGEGDGG
jgi:hypothetical protein